MVRLVALLFVFAGGSSAFAQQISLPADLASKPRALWQAVMTEVYGPYDKAKKCWIGSRGAEKFCMRPHKLDKATVGGVERLFLAVGGRPASTGEGEGCHACTGNLGLLAFDNRDGQLTLVAKNGLYEESGSWGEVPAEDGFAVEKIGPDNFGWVVESGYTAQGVTGGGKEVFAIETATVLSLGYIPTFMDNCGAVINEGDKCDNYEFALTFGPKGSGVYFDALAEAAKADGLPAGSRRFDIPFDAKEKKYKSPEALENLLEM